MGLDGRLYCDGALSATDSRPIYREKTDHWDIAWRPNQQSLRSSIVDDHLSRKDCEILKAYHKSLRSHKEILQNKWVDASDEFRKFCLNFHPYLLIEKQRQWHLSRGSYQAATQRSQLFQMGGRFLGCIEEQ